MKGIQSEVRQPPDPTTAKFFALVFLLSAPFWITGGLIGMEIMPGLPLSSLMVVSPAAAALFLRWHTGGRKAVATLVDRFSDVRRLRAPGLVAVLVLTNPVIYLASALAQTLFGIDLPWSAIELSSILGLVLIFFLAAALEELGWTAYATDRLREHRSVVQTGLILGLVWAVWHLVPLLQIGRSADWIFWWAIGSITTRILMVWLYEHTGRSLFAMSLYHALSNTCWQLYPVNGSFHDPRLNAVFTAILAVALMSSGHSGKRKF